MVKLLHFSDTHVSHRRFRDVKDTWKVHNRVTWIEEDYCQGFKEALEIASKIDCDYLVHSGDLFDIPVGRNFSGPTEYSRAFVIRELKNFFEKTNYEKPLIIIDGNHGTYLTRNNSTLEFIQAAFPRNVHIFTNYHLKDAIRENTPLILEMEDVNFYLFPYLKFGRLESWYEEYEKWLVNNQQPDSSKISIAVAHGMDRGMDLHELVLQYKYDYVALGHDHNQRKIKKNAWQSGSTAKYTFAERDQKKGVLEVQIMKGEDPVVTPHLIDKTRIMKQIDMTLNTDLSVVEFEKKLKEKMIEFKTTFNGDTATRLKFNFDGSILLSNWWNMEDVLIELQKDGLGDNYNLLEFRWDSINVKKRAPISLEKSAQLYDYLIEDPVVDFERYIRSLSLENEKQAMQFIDLGANIIEEVFMHAVKEVKTEKEDIL